MNFSARVIPPEEERGQLVESTYIRTTYRLPTNGAFTGKGMNFQKMANCLKKGIKARRPTWKEGEFLWKEKNILVHNTPYWEGEVIDQYVNGYPYVVEKEDINANDWIICKEEE